MKTLIEKVTAYKEKSFTSENKDAVSKEYFFNFFDGTVTCMRCDKKMSAFRSLFHFHI